MKHTYFKRALAWVIFSVLTLGILFRYNEVLEPKYTYANSTWPTTSSYEQFYKMKENSIDVLFFGASVAVNTFLPQELYNDYGITSFNLGSEQQSVFLSYYWLKEALRFQKPKVVVIDSLFLNNMHPENPINTTEGLTRKCLDPMRLSPVKMDAVKDLCNLDESQTQLSYILTNFRFHDRWESLGETDWNRSEYTNGPLMGYGINTAYGDANYQPFKPSDSETMAEFTDVETEYMQKIADLCNSHGIKLVICTIANESMNDGINNWITNFAKSNGAKYINMCRSDVYKAIGAKLPKENIQYHSNIWGAIKVTKYLGKILQNEYSLSAHKDGQYESAKAFYELVKKECDLTQIEKPVEYLRQANDSNYSIFITINGISTDTLDDIKSSFTNLGFNSVNNSGVSHLAFAKDRESVLKDSSISDEAAQDENAVQLNLNEGRFRNNKSRFSIDDINGTITIDGGNCEKGNTGINIVIYDDKLMKVVDSVNFSGDDLRNPQVTR